MPDHHFRGVIPALITPSDENDRPDAAALEALVHHLLRKGVSGFYLTGSTGEGLQMDAVERNEVVARVCSIVGGRVPVIAHTGTTSTRGVIELSQAARDAGADAVSSVPPFYYSFTEREIVDYYTAAASSTDLPFFIYNIPGTTGIDLSLSVLSELFEHNAVAGLKFTSYDIYKMERVIGLPSRPIVFSGIDEMAFYGLWAGAHALVGSSYNLLADTAAAMYQAFQEQDYTSAHHNYRLACELLNVLLEFPYPAALRRVIEWDGCPVGSPRKPFAALDSAQENALRIAVKNVLTKNTQGRSSLRESLDS